MVKALYKFFSFLITPFLRIYFYYRCIYGKDKRKSVINHFGVATVKRPIGKLLWIHAASVGESTAALTYIRHIKKQLPDLNILITTITVTSAEILKKKIDQIDNCFHQYIVADTTIWVKKFVDYWNMDAAIFLESEIWPNIVDALHSRTIPIYLLNARLSPRSFNRWKHLKIFFSQILNKFDCIMAQSIIDAERYAYFSPNNVKRIDNLKYANELLPCNNELLEIFRKLCANAKILVAASTHELEEDLIIEAHKKLRKKYNVITIIIPRHPVRIKSICEIFKKQDVSYTLRSLVTIESKKSTEIYCVDTFGEVGTFFRMADVCFVGGSFVPIGGHNIYEPVSLGKPVLHGVHMENAIETRNLLHEKMVAFEIKNADDIVDICSNFFENPHELENIQKLAFAATQNSSLQQIDDILKLSNFLK